MKRNSSVSTSFKNFFLYKLTHILIDHILILIKRLVKYYLHFVTGKTEIERICETEKIELIRIKKLGMFYFLIWKWKESFVESLKFSIHSIELCISSSKTAKISATIVKPNESRKTNEKESAHIIIKLKKISHSDE